MRLGLNEIMSVIDKVKSAGLTAFEYQDADVRLKIGNKNSAGGMAFGSAEAPGAACGTYGMMQGTADSGTLCRMTTGTADVPYTAAAAWNTADPRMPYTEAQNVSTYEGAPEALQKAEGAAQEENKYTVIESPMVGTFYAAASEKAEPFVKAGDTIKAGQTVGIVEAMKLMNEIEAECSGIVEEILAENGQMVEYGQPLMRVRTDV